MFFPRVVTWLTGLIWLVPVFFIPAKAQVPFLETWPTSHPLLTGQLYPMPHPRINGHPWLLANWEGGQVSWQGQWIDCPKMRYDLVLDQLVVRPDTGMAEIILLPVSLVPGFTLRAKTFLRLDETRLPVAPAWLQQGYYEQAYRDEERELLIKHDKHLNISEKMTYIDRSFKGQRLLFLYQGGSFYRLRGKGSLLKLLADQKPALRRYLRRREIRFRRASSEELAGLLAYYATLR